MTNIDIARMYGTVRFTRVHAGDQSDWHAIWSSGEWSHEAYGKTKEEATDSIVSGLSSLIHQQVVLLER